MDWLTGESIGALAGGLAVTVGLTIITSLASMAIGIAAGTLRLSNRPAIRRPATAFVEIFRNVPALIQIIFWAFAVPNLFPIEIRPQLFFNNPVMDVLRTVTGLQVPYYGLAAVLGLTLNTSAHLAEVFRSGVGTIPVEQLEGARTLGADRRQAFRAVILPSGLRASFPAITTRLVHNLKNTSLASFVAVPELFSEVQGSITRTFRATEYLLLAAVLYLVLTWLLTLLLNRIDDRLHRGQPTSGRRIGVMPSGRAGVDHG